MTRFRMRKITVQQFAILTETPPTSPQDNIELNIQVMPKYSVEAQGIATSIKFQFLYDDKPFILLELTCEFQIEKTDWKEFVQGDKIVIPKFLLETFVVHTIGTARGIMYCKTEGTPFNIFILPPLNVTEFIKGDLVIDLTSTPEEKNNSNI